MTPAAPAPLDMPVVPAETAVLIPLSARQAGALSALLTGSAGDPGMTVVDGPGGPALAVHDPQTAADRLTALAAAATDRWFALTCDDLALATARLLEERGWAWEPAAAPWGRRYVLHGPPTLGEVLAMLERVAGLVLPDGDPGWETVHAAGRLAARLRRAMAAAGAPPPG